MWRRRSLGLGGGSSELEEELRKSFVGPVQRKRKERLCALSPRLIIPQHEPTWHLKPAARCGYEKWPATPQFAERAYGVVVKSKRTFEAV